MLVLKILFGICMDAKITSALTYLLYPFCDAESRLYRMLYSTVWLMIGVVVAGVSIHAA
jgi:hypothetical protein